jgi:RNA polymerase sigma-70 factor, ECF subfamily
MMQGLMLLFAFRSPNPPPSREEFECVAIPYLPEIYRAAIGLLGGNRTEAEDLAQDVFLEAWKSFHRFERGTNIRAWLYKILVFRASHFRRRLGRLLSFGNKHQQPDDLSSGEIPVEIEVPDHLSDRQVVDAVAKLPSPFRETLILADVSEFSYHEIASMIGIPIGTVMSRLSRGRKLLRESLSALAAERGLGVKK